VQHGAPNSLSWQYSLTAQLADGKYRAVNMTLKTRMMSFLDAQKRAPQAAIWRAISGLVKGWKSGWFSGTA